MLKGLPSGSFKKEFMIRKFCKLHKDLSPKKSFSWHGTDNAHHRSLFLSTIFVSQGWQVLQIFWLNCARKFHRVERNLVMTFPLGGSANQILLRTIKTTLAKVRDRPFLCGGCRRDSSTWCCAYTVFQLIPLSSLNGIRVQWTRSTAKAAHDEYSVYSKGSSRRHDYYSIM